MHPRKVPLSSKEGRRKDRRSQCDNPRLDANASSSLGRVTQVTLFDFLVATGPAPLPDELICSEHWTNHWHCSSAEECLPGACCSTQLLRTGAAPSHKLAKLRQDDRQVASASEVLPSLLPPSLRSCLRIGQMGVPLMRS